jgi:cob(I)alamin adenosyltransferase
METIGTLDELNCWIGLVKSYSDNLLIVEGFNQIQLQIFNICSVIATKETSDLFGQIQKITKETVEELEVFQNKLLDIVKMPDKFIIPGANRFSAQVDIARTVCRRAERRLVQLADSETSNVKTYKFEKKFINRLSDILFIVARYFDNGGFIEK